MGLITVAWSVGLRGYHAVSRQLIHSKTLVTFLVCFVFASAVSPHTAGPFGFAILLALAAAMTATARMIFQHLSPEPW